MTASPVKKIKERFDECDHLKYITVILAKQMLKLYKDAAPMQSWLE
jgi:hypothetical protein